MKHPKKVLAASLLVVSVVASGCSSETNETGKAAAEERAGSVEKNSQEKTSPYTAEPIPPADGNYSVEPIPPAEKVEDIIGKKQTNQMLIRRAIHLAADYYNKNEASNAVPFPKNIRTDETITQEFELEGLSNKQTTLEISVEVEQEGNASYNVTLIKDWNIKIDGEEAISAWKYHVTPDKKVRLVDKSELGEMVEEKVLLS